MNVLVRLLAWTLAIALVALPVVAVLNGWIAGDRWPMRRLEVSGPFTRVSAEQVRAVVLPQVKSGFFAIHMEPIRDAIAAMPWIEKVEVRKRWPDQLVVSFTEHRAFARWDRDKLLSDHGQVFTAPGSPDLSSLPELEGPDGRAADVIALYNQVQPMFAGSAWHVQGVSLSERDSWTLHLRDGIDVVIGRNDPAERLRRFARLLPRIVATRQGSTLLRADLRYTNGFALTWQDPVPVKPNNSPKHAVPTSNTKQQAHT
ncbi:MAG TPA: cell division protein FtsQ/DivIB [Xanthomonadaceae bacterium]|jgi:cell division protein FtsQ